MEELGNGRIKVNGRIYKKWLSHEQINSGIEELATWIGCEFSTAKKPPILMEVQTGGKYLLVDLHRKLYIDVHIDAVGVTSYPGVEKKVAPKITSMWRSDVKNRDIVLVEDIIDTGDTTQFLKKKLLAAGAHRVIIVAIVARNHSKKGLGAYDRVCFIYDGDEWLHGYGLDDEQLGRQLTDIYFKTS
ncbi:MAG: phosphoribosyltransferase [Candidatus Komeilibacteria bacterium]